MCPVRGQSWNGTYPMRCGSPVALPPTASPCPAPERALRHEALAGYRYPSFVLQGKALVGFLLITDGRRRAKRFYCDLLGLPILHEDQFAIVVDAGGTALRLAAVQAVPEPTGTNAGWVVDDVNATARQLSAAGVPFERFAGIDQDQDGVWRPPGGGCVAWFRDPDGNRLSLSDSA